MTNIKKDGQELRITSEVLKPWNPCTSGYKWFLETFPQGGTYLDVQAELRSCKRFDDARWLAEKVWLNVIFKSPESTEFIAKDHSVEASEIIAENTSIKVDATGQSSLNEDDGARIGSSGDGARIGSSGDDARIGSSGYGAQIGSSGDDARIGSSGDDARINAAGATATVACAGLNAVVSVGEGGAMAVPWMDSEGRVRFAVGYAGENVKAGAFYRANEAGELVEVDQQ